MSNKTQYKKAQRALRNLTKAEQVEIFNQLALIGDDTTEPKDLEPMYTKHHLDRASALGLQKGVKITLEYTQTFFTLMQGIIAHIASIHAIASCNHGKQTLRASITAKNTLTTSLDLLESEYLSKKHDLFEFDYELIHDLASYCVNLRKFLKHYIDEGTGEAQATLSDFIAEHNEPFKHMKNDIDNIPTAGRKRSDAKQLLARMVTSYPDCDSRIGRVLGLRAFKELKAIPVHIRSDVQQSLYDLLCTYIDYQTEAIYSDKKSDLTAYVNRAKRDYGDSSKITLS